jgi:branched-chain amino acid transport system substrate-binding protein
MNRALLVGFVAAALAAVGTSALAQGSKISGNQVRIGVMSDMSGLYSDLGGSGATVAAQMAIDAFIAANKPAYKIDVVSADHQNKADVGANKIREWFDTQGVDMVTELLNSAVALASAKVANEKKKLAMISGAATSRLSNEDCNPFTIHYAYDTYALAHGTGNAIVKQGGDSWFFITADYAFGHSLEGDTAAVVKKSGGKVLGAVRHPLNAADFSSFLLQAQSSKAKIVGLANAGGDTINSIKAANEFGLTKNQQLAGLLVFITDIHSLGLKTTQGMYLTDGWYWDLNDETRKFARAFFDKTKKMPSMIHAATYSTTWQFLTAVKATGSDDAATIVEHLRKVKMNDVFHKNAYLRADGRVMRDMYLMQVKKPEESKYPWDYYHVRATIPAEQAFQPLSESRCPGIKK